MRVVGNRKDAEVTIEEDHAESDQPLPAINGVRSDRCHVLIVVSHTWGKDRCIQSRDLDPD